MKSDCSIKLSSSLLDDRKWVLTDWVFLWDRSTFFELRFELTWEDKLLEEVFLQWEEFLVSLGSFFERVKKF
jgi:hypothetical protein